MKIRKIAVVLLSCCILSGCEAGKGTIADTKGENTAVKEDRENEAEPEFPDRIQMDVSEHVKVDAQCVYPEGFVEGKGARVIQSGDTLWDSRERIVEMFTEGQPILDVTKTSYSEEDQSENYSLTESTNLSISTDNVMNYFSEKSAYIRNVILDDTRFSSYNGDLYQKRKDLDFMPQEEAWSQVKAFLDDMGIEVSGDYTCYVMDHATMEQEESNIYQMYQEEGVGTFEKKGEWTEEDDCYFFKTHMVWDGCRIIPHITGEGVDRENVTVFYDKTGIIFLMVNGHYPMKMEQEISIQSPQKAAERLSKVLSDIISETTYEIREITLCQAIIGKDYETGKVEIAPAWECSVLVKDGEEDPGYVTYYYYDAETLENIK